MASTTESAYFPSLEKCLNGEQFILPWKAVLSAITSNEVDEYDESSALARFFSDPEVAQLLSQPFDAFLAPSPDTKARFEQKTSAINVTPSPNSPFDLKVIKEDTLWLSQAVSVDEVSALRAVVVEFQNRTGAQLLGPFSEEELAGIREAAGNSKYSSAIPMSLLSQGADPELLRSAFASQDARRQRILHTYLAERRCLLKSIETLLQSVRDWNCRDQDNPRDKGAEVPRSWLQTKASEILQKFGSRNVFLTRAFSAIKTIAIKSESGSGCFTQNGGSNEVELAWTTSHLSEMIHAMEIVFDLIVSNSEITSANVIDKWLYLIQDCGFFESLSTEESSIRSLQVVLRSLSSMVSLAILGLEKCISYLRNPEAEYVTSNASDGPYLLNTTVLAKIHSALLESSEFCFTTAGPVLLGWSALLQIIAGRASADNMDPSAGVIYKEWLLEIFKENPDPIETLALAAVNDCRVFEGIYELSQHLGSTSNAYFSPNFGARIRLVILELIQYTPALGYIPEVVEAMTATLIGGQNYWDVVDAPQLPREYDPTLDFFQQDYLVDVLLKNASARYPYESTPFLQLIRALANSPNGYQISDQHPIFDSLEPLDIFTYRLPEHFVDYETTQEEDNNNNIRLIHPIQLFNSRTKAFQHESQRNSSALAMLDTDFSIPAGTHGRIVSESGPKVAFWFHTYSALKYFGKLLETYLTAGNVVDATTGQPADRDSVSEIIELFATLMLGISRSSTPSSDSKTEALRVLEIASSGLSRNRDIISVVFEIFEEELQKLAGQSGSDVSLDVLICCIHFIHALFPVSPRRVWPLLAQSGLLGVGRGGGRLPAIVEGVEVSSGRFEFLTSCCRLYDALVEELAANTVRRKTGSKATARYVDGHDFETGVSDQILSKTLLSFTRYLIDVLETSCVLKYAVADDRRRIIRLITSTFDHILSYTYGLNVDSTTNSKPLMGTLVSSSSVIVESFLSPTSGTLRFQPLLCSYYDGLETPDSTTFLPLTSLWTSHVNAVLSFSTTLLRVGALLDRPISQLESQMFKSSPVVARLYATNVAYQRSVILLFEALILSASSHTSEPPSLLGHLGPQTSRSFLQMLSDFDKPLSRLENTVTIWHFLSIVVSSRQQWFANYLLSGRTPRAALQTSTTGADLAALGKPLLAIVLEKLTQAVPPPQAQTLAMLEFISLAQNYWPWTVYGSEKYGEFVKSITTFAGALKPIQPTTKKENALDPCHQTRIAAYIAEILAMYLFHNRQTGTSIDVKSLISDMTYFTRFAVAVPNYNSSLHGNLKHNFETRYGGCKLQNFQRTNLKSRQLGREYFYDLSLAEKMLSLDEGWNGRSDNGFRNEVALANINLSLVDAQITLFQSWKFLAIELSSKVSIDVELQKMLAKVANDCLIANARSQLPEEVFTSLSQTRTDLALVLIQRLVQARSTVNETKTLLANVWENIRSLRGQFDRVLQGSEINYYRSLLKILFLAIRIHVDSPPVVENLRASLRINQSAPIIPTILEVLKHVIAQGLRELASSIHDSAENSTPEDVALLTGILQVVLRIPGIELCYQQIVTIFASQSTAKIATTLFSWSDSIAINGDPIYGELSMLFLLELSSIPLMAEQLAIDGVLGQIASANITSYLRRGNVGPFADSAGLQRCYSIWVRGILPFLLNLLDAVQASIAGEVAIFLSQFPTLLTQSSYAFESPETNRLLAKGQTKFITLSTCSEVHSLALLTYILDQFRQTNIGSGEIVDVPWDIASVGENIEFWLGSRTLLKERVVAMGEREVEWSRKKGSDGITGLLEEKVLAELLGVRDVLAAGGD